MEANLRHMVLFEAKDNVVPAPKTTITRGFEKVAFPKMERELRDEDLVVRQKSLLACCELLAVSECYVQCLNAGVVAALVALLDDQDSLVRERAAAALEIVASKDVGVAIMVEDGAFYALVKCLEDGVEDVRMAAYKALIEAARFEGARSAVVDMGTTLPGLVELVQKEPPDLTLLGLNLLKACTEVRHNDAAMVQLLQQTDAVPVLAELMTPRRPLHVQEGAAGLLGVLCTSGNDIRVRAVKADCVKRLTVLLTVPHLSSFQPTHSLACTQLRTHSNPARRLDYELKICLPSLSFIHAHTNTHTHTHTHTHNRTYNILPRLFSNVFAYTHRHRHTHTHT